MVKKSRITMLIFVLLTCFQGGAAGQGGKEKTKAFASLYVTSFEKQLPREVEFLVPADMPMYEELVPNLVADSCTLAVEDKNKHINHEANKVKIESLSGTVWTSPFLVFCQANSEDYNDFYYEFQSHKFKVVEENSFAVKTFGECLQHCIESETCGGVSIGMKELKCYTVKLAWRSNLEQNFMFHSFQLKKYHEYEHVPKLSPPVSANLNYYPNATTAEACMDVCTKSKNQCYGILKWNPWEKECFVSSSPKLVRLPMETVIPTLVSKSQFTNSILYDKDCSIKSKPLFSFYNIGLCVEACELNPVCAYVKFTEGNEPCTTHEQCPHQQFITNKGTNVLTVRQKRMFEKISNERCVDDDLSLASEVENLRLCKTFCIKNEKCRAFYFGKENSEFENFCYISLDCGPLSRRVSEENFDLFIITDEKRMYTEYENLSCSLPTAIGYSKGRTSLPACKRFCEKSKLCTSFVFTPTAASSDSGNCIIYAYCYPENISTTVYSENTILYKRETYESAFYDVPNFQCVENEIIAKYLRENTQSCAQKCYEQSCMAFEMADSDFNSQDKKADDENANKFLASSLWNINGTCILHGSCSISRMKILPWSYTFVKVDAPENLFNDFNVMRGRICDDHQEAINHAKKISLTECLVRCKRNPVCSGVFYGSPDSEYRGRCATTTRCIRQYAHKETKSWDFFVYEGPGYCMYRESSMVIKESFQYFQRQMFAPNRASQVLACQQPKGFEIRPEGDGVVIQSKSQNAWYDQFEITCEYCAERCSNRTVHVNVGSSATTKKRLFVEGLDQIHYCFQEPVNMVDAEHRYRFDIQVYNHLANSPQIEVTRHDSDNGWQRDYVFKCIGCIDILTTYARHEEVYGCGESSTTLYDRTASECAAECDMHAWCSSFRWGTPHGMHSRMCQLYLQCWLHDAEAYMENDGGVNDPSWHFYLTNRKPFSRYHEYRHLTCAGYLDLQNFQGYSIAGCAGQCDANKRCTGFDWMKSPDGVDSGSCTLGMSCVPEWAKPAPETSLFIKRDDVFNVTTLVHQVCNWTQPIGNRYIMDCARECMHQKYCVSFQYGRIDGDYPQECLLTSSCVQGITAPHSSWDVHVLNSDKTLLGKYIRAEGRQCLYRHELGRYEGYSLAKCAHECTQNKICVGFQWRSKPIFPGTVREMKLESRCELSASCVEEYTHKAFAGMNLYYKNDSALWGYGILPRGRCVDPDWMLLTARTATLAECALKCSGQSLCATFQYGRMDGKRATECLLYGPCNYARDLDYDVFYNMQRLDLVSPLNFFKASPNMRCVRSNLMNQYYGLSQHQCAQRCIDNDRCDAFSHSWTPSKGKPRCVQYSTCDKLTNTGLSKEMIYKYIGNPPNYWKIEGMACDGMSLEVYYDYSLEQCRTSCEKMNCMSFSMTPNDNMCVLYRHCRISNAIPHTGSELYIDKFNLMGYQRVYADLPYKPFLQINASAIACVKLGEAAGAVAMQISPPAGVPWRICRLFNKSPFTTVPKRVDDNFYLYIFPLGTPMGTNFQKLKNKICKEKNYLDFGLATLEFCAGAANIMDAWGFAVKENDGNERLNCYIYKTCSKTIEKSKHTSYKRLRRYGTPKADKINKNILYDVPDALPSTMKGKKPGEFVVTEQLHAQYFTYYSLLYYRWQIANNIHEIKDQVRKQKEQKKLLA